MDKPDKLVPVKTYVPKAEHDELVQLAEGEDRSVASILRQAIAKLLEDRNGR